MTLTKLLIIINCTCIHTWTWKIEKIFLLNQVLHSQPISSFHATLCLTEKGFFLKNHLGLPSSPATKKDKYLLPRQNPYSTKPSSIKFETFNSIIIENFRPETKTKQQFLHYLFVFSLFLGPRIWIKFMLILVSKLGRQVFPFLTFSKGEFKHNKRNKLFKRIVLFFFSPYFLAFSLQPNM